MKLLTKEVIKRLPKLYATEGIPLQDKIIQVKFFTPDAGFTWYIVEGQQEEDGDWMLFGLCDVLEKEWGYVLLSQLQEIRGKLGLPVERDRCFGPITVKEAGL